MPKTVEKSTAVHSYPSNLSNYPQLIMRGRRQFVSGATHFTFVMLMIYVGTSHTDTGGNKGLFDLVPWSPTKFKFGEHVLELIMSTILVPLESTAITDLRVGFSGKEWICLIIRPHCQLVCYMIKKCGWRLDFGYFLLSSGSYFIILSQAPTLGVAIPWRRRITPMIIWNEYIPTFKDSS